MESGFHGYGFRDGLTLSEGFVAVLLEFAAHLPGLVSPMLACSIWSHDCNPLGGI
jgi:hypothetical protein